MQEFQDCIHTLNVKIWEKVVIIIANIFYNQI